MKRYGIPVFIPILLAFLITSALFGLGYLIKNQEPPGQYFSLAVWAVLGFTLAIGIYVVMKVKNAENSIILEWGSSGKFREMLVEMERLKDISPKWTDADWERYRLKNFHENKANFEANKDLLWKQWKRYENRDFEIEISSATEYKRERVIELMELYVRELRDRWHRANIKDYLP